MVGGFFSRFGVLWRFFGDEVVVVLFVKVLLSGGLGDRFQQSGIAGQRVFEIAVGRGQRGISGHNLTDTLQFGGNAVGGGRFQRFFHDLRRCVFRDLGHNYGGNLRLRLIFRQIGHRIVDHVIYGGVVFG